MTLSCGIQSQPMTYFCYDLEPETPLPFFSEHWTADYLKVNSNGVYEARLKSELKRVEIEIPVFNFFIDKELCELTIQFDVKMDSLQEELQWMIGLSTFEPGPVLYFSPEQTGKVKMTDQEGYKWRMTSVINHANGNWIRVKLRIEEPLILQLFSQIHEPVLVLAFESLSSSGKISVDNICTGIQPCLPGLSQGPPSSEHPCKERILGSCPGPN